MEFQTCSRQTYDNNVRYASYFQRQSATLAKHKKPMVFQSFLNGKLKHYKQKVRGVVTTEGSGNPSAVAKRDISMEEDDSAVEDCGNGSTPLSAMADAFEDLSGSIKAQGLDFDLTLKPLCHACSYVSVLFGCLGLAFKFAELEYTTKLRGLEEASETYSTLSNILDYDVRNDSVKIQGSFSRNLRRVRQGLDLIRILFQKFLSADDYSLKDAASSAYQDACAPYHTWAIRTAVFAGMCILPTKEQLVLSLNETDESAAREMTRYIDASLPVIEYIDNLYISRNITLDW